jgi:hypothetical protein
VAVDTPISLEIVPGFFGRAPFPRMQAPTVDKPLMTLNKAESSIDIAVASSYVILKLAIRG